MTEIAKNEPFLSSALSVIGSLVSHVEAAGIARDRIVVMGFSQGACLTTEFAIRNASRFGGFVAFSGGAIGPAGTTWDEARAISTGRRSSSAAAMSIPTFRKRASSKAQTVCERMGANVTRRIYPGMGHLVNDDEIAHARALLESL